MLEKEEGDLDSLAYQIIREIEKANFPDFKAGDIVQCIVGNVAGLAENLSPLYLDKIYQIEHIVVGIKEEQFVSLVGNPGYWKANRFVKRLMVTSI